MKKRCHPSLVHTSKVAAAQMKVNLGGGHKGGLPARMQDEERGEERVEGEDEERGERGSRRYIDRCVLLLKKI